MHLAGLEWTSLGLGLRALLALTRYIGTPCRSCLFAWHTPRLAYSLVSTYRPQEMSLLPRSTRPLRARMGSRNEPLRRDDGKASMKNTGRNPALGYPLENRRRRGAGNPPCRRLVSHARWGPASPLCTAPPLAYKTHNKGNRKRIVYELGRYYSVGSSFGWTVPVPRNADFA
jgi:hypothetical protein